MPYFIEQGREDCAGWAVVDQAGDAFGCHENKQDAIDQAIAISLADNEPFEGERASRAIDLSAPQFMRDAASQGLKYYEDGLGGDGLTAQTIREARDMVQGQVSENKWVRIAAWIARHLSDLDSPNADPNSESYPSAGVVAHLLWGSGPSKESAERAMKFAERKVSQIQSENRAAGGDKVVISDIDDTLISNGSLNQAVYDYVSSQEGSLFLVTGRPESQREETVNQLDELGISYSRLIMNDGSTANSPEYKKAVAEELLKTYDVVLAVENDEDTRDNYEALGIPVMEPSDITEAEDPEDMTDQQRSTVQVEKRFNHANFEIREESDGIRFSGYAAVFNSPSEPLPFIERIAPGAFRKSLRSRNDVKLLWNHDTGSVLGSTRAKTVSLIEDDHGLKVDALLPNTSLGRDTAELLRRGDVDAMSFGFTVPAGGDTWNSDGSERTLKSVRLFEISIVAFPAYSATAGTTSVRARSFDRLAERANVNADALTDALLKIENGEDITQDDRNLLTEVLTVLSPAEAEKVDLAMLELKKKKLEILQGI